MARGVYSSANYFEYAGAVVSGVPLTIAAWIIRSAVSASAQLASINYGGGAGTAMDGFSVVNLTGTGVVRAQSGNGATFGSSDTAGAITLNVWAHVGGVFTSATSRLAYLNGVAGTVNTTNITPTASTKTQIGIRRFQNNTLDLPAQTTYIAEVGFWNVALTAADMLQLAAGYSPLFVKPANLVAYYPLIRGDASGDEPDYKGGLKMVEQGTVGIQNHPRVFYPVSSVDLGVPATGGGPVIPVFMNQYRQRLT